MKLILNKTFNKVFMFEYLNTTMNPVYDLFETSAFFVYTSLTINRVTIGDTFPFVLFVPETLLEIIDKINTDLYNETLSIGDVDAALLLNTLYCSNKNYRNEALDYLEAQSYITPEQNADVRNMVSTLIGFEKNLYSVTYDETTDIYKYAFETPTELDTPYNETNNPRGNKLYLMFPSLVNTQFGNIGAVANTNGKFSPLQSFYNPVLDKNIAQGSYIATELGDADSLTADVKYDHLDKIEYIDSFRLRFKLPRIIT